MPESTGGASETSRGSARHQHRRDLGDAFTTDTPQKKGVKYHTRRRHWSRRIRPRVGIFVRAGQATTAAGVGYKYGAVGHSNDGMAGIFSIRWGATRMYPRRHRG